MKFKIEGEGRGYKLTITVQGRKSSFTSNNYLLLTNIVDRLNMAYSELIYDRSMLVSKNMVATSKIEDFEELYEVSLKGGCVGLISKRKGVAPSGFGGLSMRPAAFWMNWPAIQVHRRLDRGEFYLAKNTKELEDAFFSTKGFCINKNKDLKVGQGVENATQKGSVWVVVKKEDGLLVGICEVTRDGSRKPKYWRITMQTFKENFLEL